MVGWFVPARFESGRLDESRARTYLARLESTRFESANLRQRTYLARFEPLVSSQVGSSNLPRSFRADSIRTYHLRYVTHGQALEGTLEGAWGY